jgi:vancomycin resistance protein YoaR
MIQKHRNIVIFLALVSVLLLAIYLTRPVPDVLGSYTASLDGLSVAQRKNICHAARKINGVYLLPGEKFAFNSVVGPRSLEAGFVPSGALFESRQVESVGGGVCMLSSVLYSTAIKANLKIVERVPHSVPVGSVPPGLDATVWYGKNDLVIQNDSASKQKIEAQCIYSRLTVLIRGRASGEAPEIHVQRDRISPEKLHVRVYRTSGSRREMLSDDIYQYK